MPIFTDCYTHIRAVQCEFVALQDPCFRLSAIYRQYIVTKSAVSQPGATVGAEAHLITAGSEVFGRWRLNRCTMLLGNG